MTSKVDMQTARVGDEPHHSIATPSKQEWLPWIDGAEAVEPSAQPRAMVNPATGETLCVVLNGGRTEIDLAVRSAGKALRRWADMRTADRGRVLVEVARRLRECREELAVLETLNNGKPISDARQDIENSAEAFEFYGGLTDKLFGTTIPVSPEYLNYTVREPIGITGHISPWNYPLRLAVRSIAPALAAGNTVVLKPAEDTPLTALRLAELAIEAGIPKGVLNVVPGLGPEAGAALADHSQINHLSFTGSVETGIEVMRRAARNVIPVTLELGGKSPNIVFGDADLDLAVDGAMKAIFANAGQVCCAGSRLLLEETIYEPFVERLVQRTRSLRLGPGMNDPDMGPLISAAQQEKVLDYIAGGEAGGGEIVHGGGKPADPACRNGYFVEPTLIANVSATAPVACEEIFGPVLTIFRFATEDDAVRLANESPYGLVAGLWTSNLDRAHKLAAQLQVGQVYVNDFFSGSVASPFGGYKRSGFGRERGVEALHHYTQTKGVCLRLRS